jgi:hypothetical protein
MRKITKKVCGAFCQKRRASSGNTVSTGDSLALHGNIIARWTEGGRLQITLAGWNTPTTRERINGIGWQFGFGVFQRKHVPFFQRNGEPARQIAADEWIDAQPMQERRAA